MMRIASGTGGAKHQRNSTTSATSIVCNFDTASHTNDGSTKEMNSITGTNYKGCHQLHIAGKILVGNQLRMKLGNTLSGTDSLNLRYRQQIGGTTGHFYQNSTTWGVPLNYWNFGDPQYADGSFSFTIRVWTGLIGGGTINMPNWFTVHGGFRDQDGDHYTSSIQGRVNNGVGADNRSITKATFYPTTQTANYMKIDSFMYQWLSSDPTGNGQ